MKNLFNRIGPVSEWSTTLNLLVILKLDLTSQFQYFLGKINDSDYRINRRELTLLSNYYKLFVYPSRISKIITDYTGFF